MRAIALTLLASLLAAAPASAATPVKRVAYHGYAVTVPRSWPVIDLARHPRACVRFDRHAVYLGHPGGEELCPAELTGRTEAILIEPLAGAAPAELPGALRLVDRTRRVVVTATWRRDPSAIRAALRVGRLVAVPRRRPATRLARRTASAPASATAGEVYTGPGFDACSTPSTSTMTAWDASRYRGIGVYIGGVNMACSQPNLTAAWVSQESAAGWHLAPIYVGLQAPANSCGCAAIAPSKAVAEGAAAAQDAVTQAQAIGLGPGNPIYFDMEGYTRSSTNSTAVLAFLQAWTQGLHGAGYRSGVYSSSNSGMIDLASKYGTSYAEPDDIWIASWNGSQSTADPNLPSSDWAAHQRIHQYQGGHNESWGKVTINIDNDYFDAATAAGVAPLVPPAATAAPTITGAPLVGQVLTEHHAPWSPAPTTYAYQWEDCAPAAGTCTPIPGANGPAYTVTAQDAGQAIEVMEAAANAAGTGSPATSSPTALVQAQPTSGFWLLTAYGNVFDSPGAGFFGSPARHTRTPVFAGLAPTRDGRGYWLAEGTGAVLAYGDAVRTGAVRAPAPIAGMASDPSSGGFWLFTALGNVIAQDHARFRGSPAQQRRHPTDFVGMAATLDGHGYWLATATGRVYAFGDAKRVFGTHVAHPARGIVAAPGGGAWLYTTRGEVYSLGGAPAFGAAPGTPTVGMAATPDHQGYWLATASGAALAFGDAPSFTLRRPPHPVIGIAAG